jgi:GNAT superfamily N-acetyltransferase
MSANFLIRPAVSTDTGAIFGLIRDLADYERLLSEMVGTEAELERHLFGDRPFAEVLVAEVCQQVVGFALFFPTYSTFLTRPGLHLEDLFVRSEYRGQGIGKALIQGVAQVACDRGYGRLEWTVLDWNAPAIGFYQRLGATLLPDWRICRVTDPALRTLAL